MYLNVNYPLDSFNLTQFPHLHIPSICLKPVDSRPQPRISPQSLWTICCCTLNLLWGPLWGVYVCEKDCLILFPFRLPQISCFSLSLKFSPLAQTVAPMWDWTPASVPPPAKGRSSSTNTPVYPPSSFMLLTFVWFYTFFSTGQVLLSALSWCFACTSVSEGVFLTYLWREMYSTSTYSSAIFICPVCNIFQTSLFRNWLRDFIQWLRLHTYLECGMPRFDPWSGN